MAGKDALLQLRPATHCDTAIQLLRVLESRRKRTVREEEEEEKEEEKEEEEREMPMWEGRMSS